MCINTTTVVHVYTAVVKLRILLNPPLTRRPSSSIQHLSRPEAYNKKSGTRWLVFKENEGMFCSLCKKHDTQRKTTEKHFNEIPAVRRKLESVRVHADSPQHKLAIQLELLQRGSRF